MLIRDSDWEVRARIESGKVAKDSSGSWQQVEESMAGRLMSRGCKDEVRIGTRVRMGCRTQLALT